MIKYIAIAMLMLLYACGISTTDVEEPSDNTQADVMQIDISRTDTIIVYGKDSVISKIITVTDTIIEQTVDTVISVFRIDTVDVFHTDTVKMVDTIVTTVYDRIVDTAFIDRVDTVDIHSIDTIRVVDTVTIISHDTIYSKVNDTTFVERIDTVIQVNQNKPILRDTSITLSMTIAGTTVSRKFYGKTANGIFYDTTLYTYGFTCGRWCNANGYCFIRESYASVPVNATMDYSDAIYPVGNVSCEAGTYYYLGHRPRSGADAVMISKCGLVKSIAEPYVTSVDTLHFSGWRNVSEKDISMLNSNLAELIPSDSSIFLSESFRQLNSEHPACAGDGCHNYINHYRTVKDTYVANVATQYGITTREEPTRYMCAYDLNESN